MPVFWEAPPELLKYTCFSSKLSIQPWFLYHKARIFRRYSCFGFKMESQVFPVTFPVNWFPSYHFIRSMISQIFYKWNCPGHGPVKQRELELWLHKHSAIICWTVREVTGRGSLARIWGTRGMPGVTLGSSHNPSELECLNVWTTDRAISVYTEIWLPVLDMKWQPTPGF